MYIIMFLKKISFDQHNIRQYSPNRIRVLSLRTMCVRMYVWYMKFHYIKKEKKIINFSH